MKTMKKRMKKKLEILLGAVAFLVCLGVCFTSVKATEVSGNTTFQSKETATPKISETKITIPLTEKATIFISNTLTDKSKVKWSVSNKKIASIKVSGKRKQNVTIKPKKSGTVTLKGVYKGKTYKCKVKIVKTGLNIKKKTISVTDTLDLSFTYKGKKVNPNDVKWKISKADILEEKVTDADDENVTTKSFVAVGKGKVTITAKYKKKKYKATIIVKEPKLKEKKIMMAFSDEDKYIEFINPTSKIEWTIGNEDRLAIETSGDYNEIVKIIPIMTGSTSVTAKMNGVKYKCRVYIKGTSLSKTQTNIRLICGKSEQIKISYVTDDVTWEVSDKNIVNIVTSGAHNEICTVTGIAYGNATVKGTYRGNTYTANITVKESEDLADHVHEWDNGYVVIEPKCKSIGLTTYSCKVCNSVKNEFMDELDHDIPTEFTIDKEVSCGEDGIRSKHCRRCDEKFEEEVITRTQDHEFERIGEYTCGTHDILYICKNCKDRKYESEEIEHDYNEEFSVDIEPTCLTEGSKSRKCKYCEEKTDVTTIEALGHDYHVESDATCVQGGYETTTCNRPNCDYYKYIAVPAVKHSPKDGYCENCDKYMAGLYSTDGELLVSWDDLEAKGLDVTSDYTEETVLTSTKHINHIIEKYMEDENLSGVKFNLCIGERIKSIGTYALANTKNINIFTVEKDVQTIKSNAFYGSSTTQIRGLGGVTSYGSYVFKNCASLEMITLSPNVYNFGNGNFENCTALKIASLPSDLKTISEDTYKNCSSLTDLIIPEGVEEIGANAFYNCLSLSNIEIPSTVKTIGANAFYNCKLVTEVVLNDNITEVKKYTFYGCENLNSLKMSNNITKIEEYAFEGCKALRNVTFPTSLTAIGKYAFAKSGIENADIPSGVQTVSTHSFEECKNLKTVTIPSTVKNVESYAFAECRNLESVTLSENIVQLDESAFANCVTLKNITIPDGIRLIGNNALKACIGMEKVVYDGQEFTDYATFNAYVISKRVATSNVWTK